MWASACLPVPKIPKTVESSRASSSVATAVLAAVLLAVRASASISATHSPVFESYRYNVASVDGRDETALSGATLAILTAIALLPSTWAGIQ